MTAHSFEGMPEVILEIDTQVYLRADRVGTAWEGRGHKTKLVRPNSAPPIIISRARRDIWMTKHQQNEKVAVGFCDAVAIDRHRHIPPPLCGAVGEFWFAVIVLWG